MFQICNETLTVLNFLQIQFLRIIDPETVCMHMCACMHCVYICVKEDFDIDDSH